MQIYDYENSSEYLKNVLKQKQVKNPKFSLRSWASLLGIKNPSTLSRALNDKVPIRFAMAKKFAETIPLNQEEQRYFELLLLVRDAKDETEKALFLTMLREAKAKNTNLDVMPLEVFAMISDWYHLAIWEMTSLQGFKNEPEWIAQTLNNKVSANTVREALERLIRLGFLAKDDTGKLSKLKNDTLFIRNEVPSAAVRNAHRQFISFAMDSIENQAAEERQLSASTISIRKSDYAKVKTTIEKMHRELLSYACESGGDDLYQICTQAFKLSKSGEKPL
ncbi:MAG: TIGR02147 family protein [Pseudobdellovibrionaceae bacterium]